jgi:L-glyceraldehyde 3-phosphate reductase
VAPALTCCDEAAARDRFSGSSIQGLRLDGPSLPPAAQATELPRESWSLMPIVTPYQPSEARYDAMSYRRCGRSGLLLPALSLGLWQNFGEDRPISQSRAILRRAFDLGITHFDLANNYGPPYGTAEANFGRLFAQDFRGLRDELVISTKAGYDMWPGPYGDWGSRKYLLASLDQSLQRMGLDYVDIFYSHRLDPATPLEETLGALDTAVRQGKARYVGVSSYPAEETRESARILRELGTPLLIHQPSYSIFNRWVEPELLEVIGDAGVGCIAFSPLAQGLLTNKYLEGVPDDSRVRRGNYLPIERAIDPTNLVRVRALNTIASRRGQTLAQLALAWVLRDPRISSALVGVSSVKQLEDNVDVLQNLNLDPDELVEIEHAASMQPIA